MTGVDLPIAREPENDSIIYYKWCNRCGQDRLESEFHRRKDRGGGFALQSLCKTCQSERQAAVPKSKKREQAHRRNEFAAVKASLLIKSARERAEKKGLPCTLDRDDIKARIENGVCEVSREPFDMRSGRGRSSHAPSLDRVNSKLGYTPENVRVVLWAINAMCGEWGLETIVQIMSKVKVPAISLNTS